MSVRRALIACVLLIVLAAHAAPALALGPVKVEAVAAWWHNDLKLEAPGGSSSESAGAPSLRAAVYIRHFGVQAAQYRSNADSADATYTSADFVWRPLSLTSNSFLAIGAGYQRFEVEQDGTKSSATGARLVAEGRLAFTGLIYAYGEAAWAPRLGSMDVGLGRDLRDVTSREYEAGVGITPFPFLRVRLGYRDARVRGDLPGVGSSIPAGQATLGSKGPILGVAVNF
jgi:hypothetical protein